MERIDSTKCPPPPSQRTNQGGKLTTLISVKPVLSNDGREVHHESLLISAKWQKGLTERRSVYDNMSGLVTSSF